MAGTIVASGIGSAIGSTRVPGQDQCLFVEWAERLSFWEPASGTVTHLGSGWTQPEGICAADAQVAYITERGGDVLKVDLNNGDRANASVITSGLDAPHQAVLSVDGALLYIVEFGPTGRLLRVDLATGTTDVLVSGLERAIGLALSPDESMAYVTEQAVAGGRISRIDLASASASVFLTGLIAPFFLTWADGLPDGHGGVLAAGTHLLLAERDPANRISVIDLTASTPARRTVESVSFRPSSVSALNDRLYVFADHDITEIGVSAGLAPDVRLKMPEKPLFIGGWARVGVEVAGAGLSFDDLDFEVEGSPLTGGISPSRDATFDPVHPDVMLLAGSMPGRFAFRAIERATSVVLAEEAFEVSSEWHDERQGAPINCPQRTTGVNPWVNAGTETNHFR